MQPINLIFRKAIIALFLLPFCCNSNAQEIIKFLGIPVTGNAEQMFEKLKQKGFKGIGNKNVEYLIGVFNNENVYIYLNGDIKTNEVNEIVIKQEEWSGFATTLSAYYKLIQQFAEKEDIYDTRLLIPYVTEAELEKVANKVQNGEINKITDIKHTIIKAGDHMNKEMNHYNINIIGYKPSYEPALEKLINKQQNNKILEKEYKNQRKEIMRNWDYVAIYIETNDSETSRELIYNETNSRYYKFRIVLKYHHNQPTINEL